MNKNRVIYSVFPEHKIVVAEIRGCELDAVNIVNGRFVPHATSALHVGVNYYDERFVMPYKFKGVAKCHEDDVFDVEVGKRIALNKLTETYHKSLNTHLWNYTKYLSDGVDNIVDYLEKRTR